MAKEDVKIRGSYGEIMKEIKGNHSSVYVRKGDTGNHINVDKVGNVLYYNASDAYGRPVIFIDSFCPHGETEYISIGSPGRFFRRNKIKSAISVTESMKNPRLIFRPDL